MRHTRPDIAFAVGVVSQAMQNPTEKDLSKVKRVLRYLKGIPGKGIWFKKGDNQRIECYTDADWAGSLKDRRSTSGYCTMFMGNLVTWRSKKQPVVERSSAEAEYRAMALGICELMWLKRLAEELQVEYEKPMRLYCDNKSAICIAHNPVQHDRTKHIEIDRHFIKEKVDSKEIFIPFLPTTEQRANILTKGLPAYQFQEITSKLGLIDIFKPT